MKLEVLQENLSKSLSLVGRVVNSKPQMPILSHLLLSVKNGNFQITGSNLETTIVVPVGAKIIAEGDFTIPAKTFQEIISSLPAGKIQLELQGNQLQIKSFNFSSRVNGTPAAEYPKIIPEKKETKFWQISFIDFKKSLTETVFSAATDESRAALNGVLLKPADKSLVLAATDGFRLSVVTLDKAFPQESKSSPIIVPAATLFEVIRILEEEIADKSDKESELKLFFLENNQVLFSFSEIEIYSRLISGNFPDFEKIIPSTSTIRLDIEAEELSQAVKIAAVFARESANIIKLRLEGQKVLISANAAEIGDNEAILEAKMDKGTQEEFSIAFNYRYLLDFLNSIGKDKQISLEFTTPLAPGVFRSDERKNFFHLIMPVRVQN